MTSPAETIGLDPIEGEDDAANEDTEKREALPDEAFFQTDAPSGPCRVRTRADMTDEEYAELIRGVEENEAFKRRHGYGKAEKDRK